MPFLTASKNKRTGGWKKLHNKELHNLYFSPVINRAIKSRIIWSRHVAYNLWVDEKRIQDISQISEMKRSLGRPILRATFLN
jgi:hypothetical protein